MVSTPRLILPLYQYGENKTRASLLSQTRRGQIGQLIRYGVGVDRGGIGVGDGVGVPPGGITTGGASGRPVGGNGVVTEGVPGAGTTGGGVPAGGKFTVGT